MHDEREHTYERHSSHGSITSILTGNTSFTQMSAGSDLSGRSTSPVSIRSDGLQMAHSILRTQVSGEGGVARAGSVERTRSRKRR